MSASCASCNPATRSLVKGSTFALPFKDESFNVVINSQVIEHVPADPVIMTEMWRVLRPGGTLILGTPDYGRWSWVALEWMYGKILEGGYAHEHITHYTRKTLIELMEHHGFEVLDWKYVGYSEITTKARKPLAGEARLSRWFAMPWQHPDNLRILDKIQTYLKCHPPRTP